MNLSEPIRHNALLSPDAPAIICPDGRTVSYRELDRTIDALAQRIIELGVRAGNTVGLFGLAPYAAIVSRLALTRLGVACGRMPMPAAMLDLCMTIGAPPTPGRATIVSFDPAWVETPPPDATVSPVAIHQDDAAIAGVFPSSGTTGSPKYVTLSAGTITRRLFTRGVGIPLPADVRQIGMIGLGTLFGFSSVLQVLWRKGVAVLEQPEATGERLVADIGRHRVNHMVLSPTTLERLVAALPGDGGPLPSLESIEVSGSALPLALYELARQRLCPNIIQSYGGTETGHVAAAPMSALLEHRGAVGFLLPGVEVQAVDANDVPLPPGTEGILRVKTGYGASAYVDNPETTARVFRDGWIYNGDLGAITREGLLTVAGRAGEFINSGGNKINPRVVEEVLLSFPGIREAAAFGVPDEVGLERIWAAMVVDAPVDPAALHAYCRKRLGIVAPRHVMKMDALPRTESGKVKRMELVDIVQTRFADKLRIA